MYQTIFYRNLKSFENAVKIGRKNNTILETYYPTLSITYNDGIVIKRNRLIKKIIEFSGFTNQYVSGISGVDTSQKKIYVDETQNNWLAIENYEYLIENELFVKTYDSKFEFLGEVKITKDSGFDVINSEGTLRYSGDNEFVETMEFFTFEYGEEVKIPSGFINLSIKSPNDFDSALKYLVNNKLGYKHYLKNLNIFLIEVPDFKLRAETIFKIKDDLSKESFANFCEIDTVHNLELTYQIPYESPFHWYLQNVKSREAWQLMNSVSANTINSNPIEIATFDTLVNDSHPELIGKISEHSFNTLSVLSDTFLPNDYGLNLNHLSIAEEYNQQWFFTTVSAELCHGTGTAGLLVASNSNNDLMYSASNDIAKVQMITLRASIINSDGFVELINPTESCYLAGLDRVFSNPNCSVITSQISFPLSPFIQMVILNVTNNGRNGKGIPFFAGSGNNGSQNIFLPCNYSGVYCVGGSNALDNKAGFAQYGAHLFISAPAENILSLSPIGPLGRNLGLPLFNLSGTSQKLPPKNVNIKDLQFTNNSLQVADGTSSSAPIVGAIAATMIYVNPSLTKTQVIDILSQTARKNTGTETYTYTNGKCLELGYGIVDHEEAMLEAIALIPTTEYEPWEEPITIEITNLQQYASYGEIIEISYQITLDQSISGGTEFVSVEIYFGENQNYNLPNDPNFNLISTFVYTDFNSVSTFTESIVIPASLSGGSINKTIKVKARAYDELFNFQTYGFDFDSSNIEMSGLDLGILLSGGCVLQQVICLNTGINCTNSGGFAVKALIKNLGTLNIDIFSFWLMYKDVTPGNLNSLLHGTRINSGNSRIITGFTDSNYGTSQFISPVLVPGEERTVYLHFNLEDEDFITTEMNFPCELKLQFISLRNPTFEFAETFPFYGLEAKYSNKITLQSWPTCINCLPTPFSTSIF